MSLRLRRIIAISGGIGLGVVVLILSHRPAQAQGMVRPSGDGEFHFTTNVGSFKLLGNDEKGVTGHLTMHAKGTILVTGLDKPPVPTGSLKLEYTYLPLKKYAFHGEGGLDLTGPFRSVQWFGTNLKGDFKGRGKFRLVGEFDKNLNTGFFWTTNPKDKQYWPANSVVEYLVPGYTSQLTTPKAVPQGVPAPVAK